jgi:hypothetical protein
MGAKTTMLVASSGNPRTLLAARPTLDRDASHHLLAKYFPGASFTSLPDGQLWNTYPDRGEVYIGNFGEVTVLAANEFGLDRPSELDPRFLTVEGAPNIYLHTMHSVVDFFGYAIWRDQKLVRAFSLAPDDGILEEFGQRPDFETPFWAGEHPADDPEELADPDYVPYPFPFHPLELGEAALREFFGYQIEGFIDPSLLDPSSIPLLRFKQS